MNKLSQRKRKQAKERTFKGFGTNWTSQGQKGLQGERKII